LARWGIIRKMTGDYSFSRQYRLSSKKDFEAVFSRGKSRADDNLVVYVLANRLGHPRLGMAVGKKLGNAVMRNRLKRLIREAFRLNRDKLPESADMVVIPRKGVRAQLSEITQSLVQLTQRES